MSNIKCIVRLGKGTDPKPSWIKSTSQSSFSLLYWRAWSLTLAANKMPEISSSKIINLNVVKVNVTRGLV